MSTDDDIFIKINQFYTENYIKINEIDSKVNSKYGDNSDIDSDTDSDSDSDSDNASATSEYDNSYDNYEINTSEYIIYLFGRTIDNDTICVSCTGYTPYFYIKVPQTWSITQCNKFIEWIMSQLDPKSKASVLRSRVENKKSFRGFTNGEEFKFLKLVFKNRTAMNKTIDIFVGKRPDPKNPGEELQFYKTFPKEDFTRFPELHVETEISFLLYESNIDPLLRFLHIKNIDPCGWIKIPAGTYTINNITTCKIGVTCKWNSIQHINMDKNIPFEIMSWDIEVDSSHGDFPLAKKTYLKVASDLVDYWSLINRQLESIKKEDKNYLQNSSYLKYNELKKQPTKTIYDFLDKSFNEKYDAKSRTLTNKFCHIHTKLNAKPNTALILSITKKIEPLVTIQYTSSNIKQRPANIVKISKFMRNSEKISEMIEKYNKSWSSQDKTKILGEIEKHNMHSFPEIEGDRARQIGIKFFKYGETRSYYDIILCYGNVSKFDDTTIIINCASEKELILQFVKLMRDRDPDFIIGYNIFNFDWTFLYQRAEELGCLNEFSQLGRLLNKQSKLIEKRGKVKTMYIDIPGRIQIDIYKTLQREQPNLDSYKLDNVASHFIKSKICDVEYDDDNNTKLYVENMDGIHEENYIHILFVEGYTENKLDKKLKVLKCEKIGKKSIITVEGIVDIKKYKEKYWSLSKDDLSPSELFTRFKGNDDDRALIAKYCMMDVNLCIELINKLQMITNNMGMANVCITPLDWIFMRGQGVKILSLISKFCKKENYLLPTLLVDGFETGGYEGAFVLPPIPRVYLHEYITVLDYNSLYPSSMIAENLSHETYAGCICRCEQHILIEPITNKILNWYEEEAKTCAKCIELANNNKLADFDNKWLGISGGEILVSLGFEYEDIPHDIYQYVLGKTGNVKDKFKIGVKICRFVQYPNSEKGIIPRILMGLLKARKDTRTKQIFEVVKTSSAEYVGVVGEIGDDIIIVKDINFKPISPELKKSDILDRYMKYNSFEWSVLEGLQLAFKVSANSLYGQLGAKTSAVFLKDIAASTTATGRKQLLLAKDYVEKNYRNERANADAEVVYGDSVTKDTPIYIRVNGGTVQTIKVSDLAEMFGDENGWNHCREDGRQKKEYCEMRQNVETWTDKGWTKLNRIIRHSLASYKKIIRIVTTSGLVDVTDDHSLLKPDGSVISPKDVVIGTELLHHKLPSNDAKGLYSFISKSKNNKQYFKDQISAARVCITAQEYGYSTSIMIEDNKFVVTVIDSVSNSDKVIQLYEIDYPAGEYVYDLTTDNHHFAAGIGNIIVHNTDSIFVNFRPKNPDGSYMTGKAGLERSIELGKEVEKGIKKIMKNPQNLGYEKTFWPFIIFSKKRYVGNKYENDPNKYKQASMGIVLKRRDNCPLVKIVFGGVIDILMNKQNYAAAADYVTECLIKLTDKNGYPIDKLTISKSLNSGYKNPDQIAHKVLADRIGERENGNRPQIGDRIPYVYIVNPNAKLQSDKIETPSYVLANNLEIDKTFYITNQISKPVGQIFALFIENLDKRSKPEMFDSVYKKWLDKGKSEAVAAKKRQEARVKAAQKYLFDTKLVEIKNIVNRQRVITSWLPVVSQTK
jgi:DNA polymerase elongation subunit (family B)